MTDSRIGKYFINDRDTDSIVYGMIVDSVDGDTFSIARFDPDKGMVRPLRHLASPDTIDTWILCDSLEELQES